MRGKKSDDQPLQFEKRSYGFFGTRGKKNPRWEIRGKFVGVRGKKWDPQPELLHEEQDETLVNDLLDNIERIETKTDFSPTLGNAGT